MVGGMGGGVPYLSDANAFQSQLAKSGPRLVAVDFTATWCGPCQMIGPRFEAMAPEFPFVDFVKVDVDDNQETAAQCGIRAMPTFKFYRSGNQVAEFTGADEGRLRAILAEHGGPPTAIAAGQAVFAFGLKAKPELNGQRGVVRSFDAANGRYAVALSDDNTLALKRDNLVQACKVQLVSADEPLPDDVPAGCTEGEICGYLPDAHAYQIRLAHADAAVVDVPVACTRLSEGTPAVVVGLTGAAEHNGKSVHVLGVHADTGRYEVAVTASQQLRLKRANVRA